MWRPFLVVGTFPVADYKVIVVDFQGFSDYWMFPIVFKSDCHKIAFLKQVNICVFINLFQREFLCVTLQQYTIKLLLEEKLSDPSRPRVSLFCDMSTEHWHYYYFHSAETRRLLYA